MVEQRVACGVIISLSASTMLSPTVRTLMLRILDAVAPPSGRSAERAARPNGAENGFSLAPRGWCGTGRGLLLDRCYF